MNTFSAEKRPLDKASLVDKVVDNLTDDYNRRGGHLTGDHILRVVDKRGLDPEDDALIREKLHTRGVKIDDPEEGIDFEQLGEMTRQKKSWVT